jgi:predicted DCC family thiol-disulfide oxidoreductase YuxK
MINQHKITVFFDNSCSICRREINHYQSIDSKSSIKWVDISDKDCDLTQYGINRLSAMNVFHVIDNNGNVHKGENAFILLWSVLPAWRVLAKIFQFKPLKALLAYFYRQFSRWRFRKQCENGVCM